MVELQHLAKLLICVDPSNHEVTSCDTSHLFPPRAYWKVQQNFIITKMWRTSRCYRSYGFKKLQKNLILFTTSMLRSTCQCSEIIQPIKSLILCCKVCSANPGCLCVPLVIGFYSLRFFCPLFSSRIYSGGCFSILNIFLSEYFIDLGKLFGYSAPVQTGAVVTESALKQVTFEVRDQQDLPSQKKGFSKRALARDTDPQEQFYSCIFDLKISTSS